MKRDSGRLPQGRDGTARCEASQSGGRAASPMTSRTNRMTTADAKVTKALNDFAKAVDAVMVFRWGSRETNPGGEAVDAFAEREDQPRKYARLQKARDELVRLGLLGAVR